jgi:hypothetical protein
MRSVQARRLLGAVAEALLLGACSSERTIQGTVVDGFGGPVAGQTVIISSTAFSQKTVTNVNGTFTVTDAPSPYDASLIFTGGGGVTAVVFAGLTRLDPTLVAGGGSQVGRMATLSGRLTGGHFPEASGEVTNLIFGSPQVSPYSLGQDFGDPTSSNYESTIYWVGPNPLMGTLYALQVQEDAVSGLPVDYPGYGTQGVALEDGATISNQNVVLGPVTTGTLTGTISVPPGYTSWSASVSLAVAPGVFLPTGVAGLSQDAFSFVTPVIPGTSLVLGASAQAGDGVNVTGTSSVQLLLSDGGSSVTLVIPAAPTLLQPVAGATDITLKTVFTWTQVSGAVYIVDIVGPFQDFTVYTAATTLTIPDLADAGLSLVPSTSYLWVVSALAPIGSVDDVVAPEFVQAFFWGTNVEAVSNQQYFTTGP